MHWSSLGETESGRGYDAPSGDIQKFVGTDSIRGGFRHDGCEMSQTDAVIGGHNSLMARNPRPVVVPSPQAPEGRWWFLVRPQVIYGTIIVSAVIVAAPDNDADLEVIGLTASTIVLVWVAHVFSEIAAGQHTVTNPPTPFRAVLAHAMTHGVGLLISAVLPVVTLAIGVVGLLPNHVAYLAALGVGVLSLAVLGWFVFAHRGNAWPIRLAGAVGTGLLGAIVVALNALVH